MTGDTKEYLSRWVGALAHFFELWLGLDIGTPSIDRLLAQAPDQLRPALTVLPSRPLNKTTQQYTLTN
jgi:hypothetical protein